MNIRLVLNTVALIASIILGGTVTAQTRSIRDTATAYGARLNASGLPLNQNRNRNRINTRVNGRIDNRLALQIERYQPNSTDNPVAAFTTSQNNRSRSVPVITPLPQTNEP